MTTQTKPNDVITGFNGLTKREYFAAMAMQALMNSSIYELGCDADVITVQACNYADYLIFTLNEKSKEM